MRRRRRKLLVILITVVISFAAVVAAIWRFIENRYRQRPFFAQSFVIFGKGAILDWQWGRCYTDFGSGLTGFYDLHERVLLVVPVASNTVEWHVGRQPVSDRLRIIRHKDGVVKVIPWRRNSIILLDEEGVPKYADLSEDEFNEAVWNNNMEVKEKLLQRVRQGSDSP